MSDLKDTALAPDNGDEQRGFNKAFAIMSIYWTSLSERFTDPVELMKQFDSFMMGVQAKLVGYSSEESAKLIQDLRKEDGLFSGE